MTNQAPDSSLQALVRSLAGEFFQTDTSAVRHGRREVARLEDSPPTAALLAISQSAERALQRFAPLAKAHGLATDGVGVAVGELFSQVRDKLADKSLRAERSYRGTLLGIRHGIDVVRMLRAAAEHAGYADLVEFCHAWLDERLPLVGQAERALDWFAEHPEKAMQRSRALFGGGVPQAQTH